MARNLHVYPKATIDASTWTLLVKVFDQDTRTTTRNEIQTAAGVIAETPLRLLKVSFDLVVGDADTDQDVVDAFTVDDIKPGAQTETVWGNWIETAEGIIGGLASPYTAVDFWAAWAPNDTAGMRQDARRALITQRGWTVPVGTIHQHEGDGTSTDE